MARGGWGCLRFMEPGKAAGVLRGDGQGQLASQAVSLPHFGLCPPGWRGGSGAWDLSEIMCVASAEPGFSGGPLMGSP